MRACRGRHHEKADPEVDHRNLAITVNARSRCGLDPMLLGNIITTLNLQIRYGEPSVRLQNASAAVSTTSPTGTTTCASTKSSSTPSGRLRAARCVSVAFDPDRPERADLELERVRRLSHRIRGCYPMPFLPLAKVPVTGLGALVDGPAVAGLSSRSLTPEEFDATSTDAMLEYIHRFRGSGAVLTEATTVVPTRGCTGTHGTRHRGEPRWRLDDCQLRGSEGPFNPALIEQAGKLPRGGLSPSWPWRDRCGSRRF